MRPYDPRYHQNTSYWMIVAVITLLSCLACLIKAFYFGVFEHDLDTGWQLLIAALINGVVGVVSTFVTVHRLR